MINEIRGSVLNNWPEYGVLIVQANCQGVGSPGIMQQLAREYGDWFKDYRNYCLAFSGKHQHELIGSFHRYQIPGNRIICSAFVQIGISKNVRTVDYEAWDKILHKIQYQTAYVNGIQPAKWTIHMQPGSENTELPLYNLIEKNFGKSSTEFYLYRR